MAFKNLCPPALIYLLFSITQVVIDTVRGLYNTALIKIWVAFIFTILLNYLCQLGLGIISWFIVFIPFLLMTLVVAILLLMFGLDPSTGKIKMKGGAKSKKSKHHKHGPASDNNHGHHPPEASEDPIEPDEKLNSEDSVMKYFDSDETGSGGSSPVKEDETQKEKSNRILNKSLLFYSEETEENPDTKFDEEQVHLDTTKYKLFVDTVYNVLSGMGEQEIAGDLQTKAMACINSAKKMKKEDATASINSCFNDLMIGVTNKFTPERKQQFETNITNINCKALEPKTDCTNRIQKGWWN
jgi:hypothetical protein